MLTAVALISNALAARDHADRAKRLLRLPQPFPLMKRRAHALEEAATRMELEAKAALLRRWRDQAPLPAREPQAVQATAVPYVERRKALHPLRRLPERIPPTSQRAEPTINWGVLISLQPPVNGTTRPPASPPTQ
jgi:hypothetical protein